MNGTALPIAPAAVAPAPRRECGTCRLCCKVLAVQEIDKPRGSWCQHSTKPSEPGGCAIYATRPGQCRGFQCLWLAVTDPEVAAKSQRLADTWARIFPVDERPDRIRVVFSPFLGGIRSPRTGAMHRAAALQLSAGPGLDRAIPTIARLLEANYAVIVNNDVKSLGAWIPHEPESLTWENRGRIMGTAPFRGLPERTLDRRKLGELWYATVPGSQAERLFDSTKATTEERANVDEAAEKALDEIEAGEDYASDEVDGTAEAHAEEARGLALDNFWTDDGGEG